MKGKYITTQILLACLSKPVAEKKEIPVETKETNDRDIELMRQWKLKIQLAGDTRKISDDKQAA